MKPVRNIRADYVSRGQNASRSAACERIKKPSQAQSEVDEQREKERFDKTAIDENWYFVVTD